MMFTYMLYIISYGYVYSYNPMRLDVFFYKSKVTNASSNSLKMPES